MFILIFILVANSCVPQFKVANVYRLNFAGIQIGIWEISLLVGAIAAFMSGSGQQSSKRHPAMLTMMILLGLGFLAGVAGDVINNASLKDSLTFGREYGAWPLCVFIGYRL